MENCSANCKIGINNRKFLNSNNFNIQRKKYKKSNNNVNKFWSKQIQIQNSIFNTILFNGNFLSLEDIYTYI